MIESNLITKRIAMYIMMNNSEGRRRRRRINRGRRNVLVEDATLTGRMIQTMNEEVVNALSKFVKYFSPSQVSSQPTAIKLDKFCS